MKDTTWKAKFRETKITDIEEFLVTVEQWWNSSRSPLVMQGGEILEKQTERISDIAVKSGLHVVKINCSADMTYEDLYGTANAKDFHPGTIGAILMQDKHVCLILDNAESYPRTKKMISALINLCEERKLRFGKKDVENKNISVKAVLTADYIEDIDFLIKPWIYAKQ